MLHAEKPMKRTLRCALADSHIAAIAILVLWLWCIKTAITLWLDRLTFLFLSRHSAQAFDRSLRIAEARVAGWDVLLTLFVGITGAWLLSHWTYGVGPLSALNAYWQRASRRNRA